MRTAGAGTIGRNIAAAKCSSRGEGAITLGLCALALAASAFPYLAEHLQYDRAAIAGGEWWRVLTGHFTHWSADHLFWDAAVFAALGLRCERTLGRAYLPVLLVASLTISAAVWFGAPEIPRYRGLSGLDSALFTLAAVALARGAFKEGRWWTFAAAAGFLAAFCGKTAFEVVTGCTLFVNSAAAGFKPLPLAHAAGGAAAALLGCLLPRAPAQERRISR